MILIIISVHLTWVSLALAASTQSVVVVLCYTGGGPLLCAAEPNKFKSLSTPYSLVLYCQEQVYRGREQCVVSM